MITSSLDFQKQIITACIQGNPRAQQEIFNTYAQKMLALTKRYTKDPMEAEDILMLGFRKVFDRISTYNGSGSFEGWIRRIMINCALNVLQHNQRRIHTVPMEEAIGLPCDYTANNTDIEYLLVALKNLPICLRTPFNLFAIEGFSHKEIAENLGISEVLSKVRVTRARKALREALSSSPKEDYPISAAQNDANSVIPLFY